MVELKQPFAPPSFPVPKQQQQQQQQKLQTKISLFSFDYFKNK